MNALVISPIQIALLTTNLGESEMIYRDRLIEEIETARANNPDISEEELARLPVAREAKLPTMVVAQALFTMKCRQRNKERQENNK